MLFVTVASSNRRKSPDLAITEDDEDMEIDVLNVDEPYQILEVKPFSKMLNFNGFNDTTDEDSLKPSNNDVLSDDETCQANEDETLQSNHQETLNVDKLSQTTKKNFSKLNDKASKKLSLCKPLTVILDDEPNEDIGWITVVKRERPEQIDTEKGLKVVNVEKLTKPISLSHKISQKKYDETLMEPYKCNNCKKIFLDKRRITQHLETCPKLYNFTCPYCDYTKRRFSSKILNHIENEHPEERKYCRASYETSTNSMLPKKILANFPVSKFRCYRCPSGFNKSTRLQYHAKSECRKLFICLWCKKTHRNISNIEKHCLREHKKSI